MVDINRQPLKLASEFATYADKHEIFDLMMQLYQSLIVNRPDDPLTHLIDLLKCQDLNAFTIIILGPPSSGKHTVAQLICKICPTLELVDPLPVIRNFLHEETRQIPKQKRPTRPKRYRVPPNVAAYAISWHLKHNVCTQRGWVMPGFPRNKTQAMELGLKGIVPQYVINLELSDLRSCSRFAIKYPEYKEYFMDASKTSKSGDSYKTVAQETDGTSADTSSQQTTMSPTAQTPRKSVSRSPTKKSASRSSSKKSGSVNETPVDLPKSGVGTPDKSEVGTPGKSGVVTPDKSEARTPKSEARTPKSEARTPKSGGRTPKSGRSTPDKSGASPPYTYQTPIDSLSIKPPTVVLKFQRALVNFRRNLPGLISFYGKAVRKVNGGLKINAVIKSIVEILETRHRTLTPFNPRILLLGPPGSGKRTLATSLANKYDLVNLHCGELLRQRKARLALDDLELDIANVRDEFVASVVKDRLTKLDCVISGWILRGFPRNPNQAILFRQANFFPNKVLCLDISDDDCLDRVLPRRIDPVTGITYHIPDKVPKDPAVTARLVVHPRDHEEIVCERLSRYRHHEESLAACYSQSQYIDGKGAIFSVFERLESALLRPNPRRIHIPADIFPTPSEDETVEREETPPINFHNQPLDIDFVDVSSNCVALFDDK